MVGSVILLVSSGLTIISLFSYLKIIKKESLIKTGVERNSFSQKERLRDWDIDPLTGEWWGTYQFITLLLCLIFVTLCELVANLNLVAKIKENGDDSDMEITKNICPN